MTVLLITGTDTGVGKTIVTAALAAALSRSAAARVTSDGAVVTSGRRQSVAVFKVVQAGLPADADEVRRLSGLEHVFEGGRVEDPLNPTTAARLRDVKLQGIAEHTATIRRLAGEYETVIVEGAGGLLVGLDNEGRTLVDLSDELGIAHEAVIVTRPALGTLNHTQLTVAAMRAGGVPIKGLVIGSWPDDPGLADTCNLEDLPALTGLPVLGRIPAGAGRLHPQEFRASAGQWLDLDTIKQ